MERGSEEDARRAVQLGDHHTLSTVDDEGAAGGHVRDGAQINVLNHGLEILVFDVIAGELHLGLQRNAVGEAALDAFVHRVTGTVDVVVKELEYEAVPLVGDGEVFGEDPVEAFVAAFFRIGVDLEELLERLQLDVQQVGVLDRPCGRKTMSGGDGITFCCQCR